MGLSRLAVVGKQIQTRVINSLLVLVLSLSSLMGASLFWAQKAAAAPLPSVVYNATPTSLPANVASLGFQATQTSEFGDYVHIGGTDRALRTVTVTMSDWALASTPANATFCSTNPSSCFTDSNLLGGGGFYHPITLNVYSSHLGVNGAPDTLLATKTQVSAIPWRPAADPVNCPTKDSPGYDYKWQSTPGAPDTNCSNGFAFNLGFDFSGQNVALPDDVIVGVAYSTQSYGAAPLGVDGPYNSLNVGVPSGQTASVGTDDSSDKVFWNTSNSGNYTGGGTAGIFRQDTAWIPNGTVAFQITAASLADVYIDSSYTLGNAGGHTFGYDAFNTIQAGMNAVAPGGTVHVAAGDYSSEGTITINKALTLAGTQADIAAASTTTGVQRTGSESTLSRLFITSGDATVDGFSFNSSNVSGQVQVLSATTLSGISIKDNIFSGYDNVALPTNAAGNIVIENNYFTNPSPSAEAMQIKTSGNTGDCSGTQVLNNVFTNATTNGSADINFSCTDSSSTNVTVSGNRSMNASDPNGPNMVAFSGVTDGIVVSNNTATTSGSQVLFFGSVSGTASITGNSFTNGGGNAVSIHGGDNFAGVNDSSNSGTFTIANNSFVNNAFGVRVATGALTGAGTVNASLNYWGSDNPDFASLVSTGVTTSPYFTNSTLTIRSDNKVAPDSGGNATVNNSTPQVVVSDNSQPLTVTVGNGTNNASIDLSSLVTSGPTTATATLPQITINSSTANVSIPASTIVSSSDPSWNGVINAPKVVPSVSVPSPVGTTVATAIEVGAGNINLTFDKAVRLLIPGQARKLVGFVRNGNFTQIANVCTADSQTDGDALVAGGDCYMNASNGIDMVVWTKHFTTFVAYSQSTTPSSSSSSSSSTPTSTSTTSSNTTSSDNSSSAAPTSEVLGNSTTPLTSSAHTQKAVVAAAVTTTGRILGLAWYWWILILLALIVAAVTSVMYLADTPTKSR